jgi:hypothetical protein
MDEVSCDGRMYRSLSELSLRSQFVTSNEKANRYKSFSGCQILAVESRILFLRHQRVILDSDIAELYRVPVKRLNEQVKRNQERFPSDFMFRLSGKEYEILRSQIATSKERRGGRRYTPYAFTEHGAIMAATVLNSERAV